jgi:hypothetical protein
MNMHFNLFSDGQFTFQVKLYHNGTIIFAYKTVRYMQLLYNVSYGGFLSDGLYLMVKVSCIYYCPCRTMIADLKIKSLTKFI